MTTMAEVASEAGVSTTTVSHVLNGTRHVSDKTVERVRAAVERTGYRPNSIARALAGARTRSIGAAISGLSNPYFMDVISAIESEAAQHGHTLLLGDTRDEAAKELQMVQELVLRKVDGILLAPSPGAEANALRYLRAQDVPVVILDRFLPTQVGIDQVGTDNEEPTIQLVRHLAELGHRRIGLIAALAGVSTTDERIAGYRAAVHMCGMPIDEDLIVCGGSQHESARAAAHQLLELSNPPDALVSGNNTMTIGVLQALRDRGLRVPDDIALVAFDDFAWSDLFQPRLTVIAQPTREIGARAVELLLARLDDRTRPAEAVRVKPRFVHRESCGCHPADDSANAGGSASHA